MVSGMMYLFYNADLIEIASDKSQTAVAYVDDVNLYLEVTHTKKHAMDCMICY